MRYNLYCYQVEAHLTVPLTQFIRCFLTALLMSQRYNRGLLRDEHRPLFADGGRFAVRDAATAGYTIFAGESIYSRLGAMHSQEQLYLDADMSQLQHVLCPSSPDCLLVRAVGRQHVGAGNTAPESHAVLATRSSHAGFMQDFQLRVIQSNKSGQVTTQVQITCSVLHKVDGRISEQLAASPQLDGHQFAEVHSGQLLLN